MFHSKFLRPLLEVGLSAFIIGVVFCLVLTLTITDQSLFAVLLPGIVLTALVCVLIWWLLVLRSDRLSIKRGILAGFVCSVLAHPIITSSFFVSKYFLYQPTTPGPFELFLAVPVFTLWFYGWLTSLIGVGAGALLAYWQRKRTIRMQELSPMEQRQRG